MMNSRKKFKFGLLETPDSTDQSSLDETTPNATDNNKTPVRDSLKILHTPLTVSEDESTICTSESEITPNKDPTIFQIPAAPAPRKFSTLTTPRTPLGDNNRSSGSSTITPNTSGSMRNTPRSNKSTPRGRGSGETPRVHQPSVVVSIVEGRGLARGEVGLASIDLKRPVLTLSQFADSQTYVKTITKLNVLSPMEIIFPSTMCDNGNMTKIFQVINDNFQSSKITTVQRHYFNESRGMDCIQRLVMKENSSVIIDVKSKYYCLAASAALLKFVEFMQNTIYAPQSLRIIFKGSEQTTLIDARTASALELLVNLDNPKSNQTLFGLLNRTKTLGGTRMLRGNILQPPNDLATIQARLDGVEELSDSSELFFGLQSVLSRFEIDIDHLLSSLVQIPKQNTDKSRENHITTCIYLKHVTTLVPILMEALTDSKCELFQAYKAALQDVRFGCLSEMLEKLLREEVQLHKGQLNVKMQRCYAVKQGINGVLDLSRITYTELINDVKEVINQIGETHKLPLKCVYNSSRGFYIQMAAKESPELPSEFIKVTRTKKTISFTTQDIIQLNTKIEHSITNIVMLSDSLVTALLADVRGSIGCLYNLSEIVSTLDMILAFAVLNTTSELVRPEFTHTLAVRGGYHPVLKKHSPNLIPNNIYASDGTNLNIITGPNMSGKSTYLKTIALLQIMAQIGCFVPAEFASFRIADQVFSRVGSDDDLETNSSSFMLEMKEVNYIIQNVTGNSLVIIDELGRGTSSEEGVGLCWAICEFLLSQKAFTFFATHFMEICRLENVYPNLENYHFEIKHVISSKGNLTKIQFTYVLSRGFTTEVHYGLKLAELFNFPESVMAKAQEVASNITKKKNSTDANKSRKQVKSNAAYRFATKLLQVGRSSRLNESALKEYLKQIKVIYETEIKAVESATFSQCDSNVDDSNVTIVSDNANENLPTIDSPAVKRSRVCDVTEYVDKTVTSGYASLVPSVTSNQV